MNGDDKAFPIIDTKHEAGMDGIKHIVESNGGMTKREFAAFMCMCGFVANGRPFTVDEVLLKVDQLIVRL